MDYYHVQDVIRSAARRLKRTLSDEELKAAKSAGAWNPALHLWDDRDLSRLVAYLKTHPPRTEAGETPDHWPEHSDEVMECFKEEQRDALELFCLEAPLELAQIADFLIDQAEHEPRNGDPLSMSLPSARGPAEEAVIFFRGYFQDEWDRRNREAFQTRDAQECQRLLDETRTWALERATSLYRFSLLVHDLAETTGIGEVAAIAFLLADSPVRLPRLAYQTRVRLKGKNPGTTITLTISDLSVKPQEVQWAYRVIRSQMLRDEFSFPFAFRGRQRIREQSDRTRQMVAFCRAREGTMKFPQIRAEWNTAHPEWTYETPRSLYNAYHVARERWGIPKKSKS
jgi:hypothetical protein